MLPGTQSREDCSALSPNSRLRSTSERTRIAPTASITSECQGAPVVREQVHRQEGDVVEHVDPAQPIVELDAVEGSGLAGGLQHVRQVQVTVAFAHAPVAPTLLPQRRERLLLHMTQHAATRAIYSLFI